MKKIFLAFLLSSFFIACDKEAGEGGTSSIEGQVWEFLHTKIHLLEVGILHFTG